MSAEPSPLSCGYDLESIRKYTFPIESIPRLSVSNPEVFQRMKASLPVVITGSQLVESALKWNLEYLQAHLGDGFYYVYASKDNRFKYYDLQRIDKSKTYPIPTKRVEVTFPQFINMLKERKHTKEKVYLQQTLNRSVGKAVMEDFLQFKWDLVQNYQRKLDWGPLSSNLLLIGLEGNITPVHYDEQENIFTQISGYKRCLLFSPDQFENLYPHPVAHPCDRQSQVDFEKPDFARFPKFQNAHGMEAIVGPGDVLYIPMYWWHQIESLSTLVPPQRDVNGANAVEENSQPSSSSTEDVPPVTISVNFWYRASSLPEHPHYPLSGQQRVSVMRNVEKLLANVLGSSDEVGKLLRCMVDGRYTED